MDRDTNIIGQTPPALPEDNTIVGTVALDIELTIAQLQQNILPNEEQTQQQAQKMDRLSQALLQKGFDVIYVGLFGVAIQAPVDLYNEVFKLTLTQAGYQNTSYGITLDNYKSVNDKDEKDNLSLHFSGPIDYLDAVDEMENINLI